MASGEQFSFTREMTPEFITNVIPEALQQTLARLLSEVDMELDVRGKRRVGPVQVLFEFRGICEQKFPG